MTSPKSLSPKWHITELNLSHNHDMDPSLSQFVRLSPSMLQTIQMCAAIGEGPQLAKKILQHKNPDSTFKVTEIQSRHKAYKKEAKPAVASQTLQLLLLLSQRPFTPDTQNGWYYKSMFDSENRLTRLFWMSPIQRQLYQRYHDVIVNDSTMQTNRLGLTLNCTVVVDATFKTRLVACALIRHETQSDYEWVFAQLKDASGGIEPKVVMVDEHTAVDAACPKVFPMAHVVNCIWHIYENIRRNISNVLDENKFKLFSGQFKKAMDSVTPSAFYKIWRELLRNVCDHRVEADLLDPENEMMYTGPAGEPLKRLFKRRRHWAGPWVQAVFTAGMRSTQRVEKSHHLIKMMKVNSKTSLSDLLEAICEKVDGELYKAVISSDYSGSLPSPAIRDIFGSVIEMNEKYLASYAQSEMLREMSRSHPLAHTLVDLDDVRESVERVR
jgi:hypothetical protein